MAKDLTHVESVIAQMRDISDSIERLQERYALLKDVVVQELAGDTAGEINGRPVVTYTTVTSRRFDTAWLRENMPEVYESGRKPTTSTRFQLVMETRDGA
jgi:predicted phage-related endonuclease